MVSLKKRTIGIVEEEDRWNSGRRGPIGLLVSWKKRTVGIVKEEGPWYPGRRGQLVYLKKRAVGILEE